MNDLINMIGVIEIKIVPDQFAVDLKNRKYFFRAYNTDFSPFFSFGGTFL